MRIGVFPTKEEASRIAGRIVIEEPELKVLGVATGSTPQGLYSTLRAAHEAGEFSLADKKAFALDEYVGIDPRHPEAYRNVLREELVGDDKTGLKEDDLFTPNGQADDRHQAAADYDAAISAAGGIDLQILGLGADGHIGFNEPGGSLVSRTHVDALTSQTIHDNARFFGGDISQVPPACITQGLGTIMEAGHLLLLAFGSNKAEAVQQVVEGPISARWPGTIMQMHPHVTMLLDEAAAAQLEFSQLYSSRWELQK